MFRKIFIASLLLLLFALPAKAAEMTINKIAAVVNGEIITLHDLRMRTAMELSRRGLPLDDPRAGELMRQVLDAMISDILLRHEAERFKVTVSDADVENEIEKMVERSKVTRQAFELQVKKQGSDMELLRENIHNGLLRQKMINFMIARKVVVTDDEVKKYYDDNPGEFSGQKTVDISLIVFAQNVKAEGIYKKIKSGELSFEAAVKSYSIDKSSEIDGRISSIPWDALTPDMRTAIDALSPGDVSNLLRMGDNSILVRLNAVDEGRPVTFEEARPGIEQKLREPKMQERFVEYSNQLRSKAVVDVRI